MLDEGFDQELLALLADGDQAQLLHFLTHERMAQAGNGAAEVRFWIAAHGTARFKGFQLIHSEAIAETYTGCGFAKWRRGSA